MAAVERWQRDQVEDAQPEIEKIHVAEDTENGGREVRRVGPRAAGELVSDQPDEGDQEIRKSSPATATKAMSRRGFGKLYALTGTGLAQPNPATTKAIAPSGSMCGSGKGDAPLQSRRRISEAIGDEGTGELVHGDSEQERGDLQEKPLDEGDRVAEQVPHQGRAGGRSSGGESSDSSRPGMR